MTFDESIEQLAHDIFKGKNAAVIGRAIVHLTAEEFMQHAYATYGKGFDTPHLATSHFSKLKSMEGNILEFCAAKQLHFVRECTNMLNYPDGTRRSFPDFLAGVKQVSNTYYKVYTHVEADNILTTIKAIKQWQDILQQKEQWPYITWQADKIDAACPVCSKLNGTCLPVEHPFWKNHFIPAHYGCHCKIIQENNAEHVTPDASVVAPAYSGPRAYFKRNAGQDGVIIPKSHPYHNLSEVDKQTVNHLLLKQVQRVPYILQYTGKGGGELHINPNHSIDELQENIAIGTRLADNGEVIMLPAHVQIDNIKNPDAVINGIKTDFKKPDTAISHKTIKSHIAKASKQRAQIIVFVIDNSNITPGLLKRSLNAALKNETWHKNVKEIWVLRGSNPLLKISRNQITHGNYELGLQQIGLKISRPLLRAAGERVGSNTPVCNTKIHRIIL